MDALLEKRRRSLEDAFFLQEDAKLVARLKDMRQRAESRQALAEASGLQHQDVLDALVALNIRPETLAPLTLIPLVEAAWADGAVDARERQVALAAVEQRGVAFNATQRDLFARWLAHRPAPELFRAWEQYLGALSGQLPERQREELRVEILARTRQVAEASGGLLGVGKISKAESRVLQRVEQALR